jgi:hypothetical protein
MARAGFDRLPWVSILLCAFSFLQSRGDGYLFTRRTRQRIDHRGQSRWELFQIDVKEVQTGTWRLIDAENSLYDTGIEFDGGSGYANEYRLTRHGFSVCWEVREDQEYWCKKKDGK